MPRFGRPGLLGTIARTAVITGTVRATSNAMQRGAERRDSEQQQRAYAAAEAVQDRQQYQPPAPAQPAPAAPDDLIANLGRLADLHTAGALSDEQFEQAKSRLLSS